LVKPRVFGAVNRLVGILDSPANIVSLAPLVPFGSPDATAQP
jgi:hypothetical protein